MNYIYRFCKWAVFLMLESVERLKSVESENGWHLRVHEEICSDMLNYWCIFVGRFTSRSGCELLWCQCYDARCLTMTNYIFMTTSALDAIFSPAIRLNCTDVYILNTVLVGYCYFIFSIWFASSSEDLQYQWVLNLIVRISYFFFKSIALT